MSTAPLDRAADRAPVRVRLAVLLALQCTVVLVCVLATTLVAMSTQERSIRTATEERVLDVARSLAELDQVRRAVLLDADAATAELQPLADVVAAASGVDYVVVTDARGIRLTHPKPGGARAQRVDGCDGGAGRRDVPRHRDRHDRPEPARQGARAGR